MAKSSKKGWVRFILVCQRKGKICGNILELMVLVEKLLDLQSAKIDSICFWVHLPSVLSLTKPSLLPQIQATEHKWVTTKAGTLPSGTLPFSTLDR